MPEIGEKEICRTCGQPIEYLSPNSWRHVERPRFNFLDGQPRHIPLPRQDSATASVATLGDGPVIEAKTPLELRVEELEKKIKELEERLGVVEYSDTFSTHHMIGGAP